MDNFSNQEIEVLVQELQLARNQFKQFLPKLMKLLLHLICFPNKIEVGLFTEL